MIKKIDVYFYTRNTHKVKRAPENPHSTGNACNLQRTNLQFEKENIEGFIDFVHFYIEK